MATERATKNTEIYEWVRMMIGVLVLTVLVFAFAARLFFVDGESMRETLQHKDCLLVLNDWLCGEYEPGDIVVLSKPSFDNGAPIVKRVIAVGGQTVDIDFTAGRVYVDGVELQETYIREPTYISEGLAFPITLREDEIFVMGDNRNRSSDSRHPDIGPVDTRYVFGRAVLLVTPGKTADTGDRDWSRIGLIAGENHVGS